MFALSFHSFIEGLCLGLIDSSSLLILVFISVLIRKAIESFSISINISMTRINNEVYLLLIIFFCLMTPCGIIIGIIISNLSKHYNNLKVVDYILQLCSGNFIYSSSIEIILEEFENSKKVRQKFLFFFIGAVIYSIIK